MFHTDFRPEQIHPSVFIGRGAVIVGDVHLAENCSVWFQAALRGDLEPIIIGANSNIQEGAIFHTDPTYPVEVAEGVTIGHRAIVHGAKVGANTVIGMGTTLLNGAVIGENSIVGANALVTQGKEFPAGSLILGSPAKLIRPLTEAEIAQNRLAAETYVQRAQAFMASEFVRG